MNRPYERRDGTITSERWMELERLYEPSINLPSV